MANIITVADHGSYAVASLHLSAFHVSATLVNHWFHGGLQGYYSYPHGAPAIDQRPSAPRLVSEAETTAPAAVIYHQVGCV